MSSWKKASKVNQKTHRERHQPEARESLGLLEKKKDYVKRARDYNEKKRIIKKLKNIALNRNPDEFYHHMVNCEMKNDKHIEKKPEVSENTLEQRKLMENRNFNYVTMKRTIETKKINKIQSELHLTEVAELFPRDHIIFDEKGEPRPSSSSNLPSNSLSLANTNLGLIGESQIRKLKAVKRKSYKKLADRIRRESQLALVQRKMELTSAVKKHKGLPVKCIKQGTKTEAPVYLWKYERKR